MRLQPISISLVLKHVDLFSFSRTNLRTKILYRLNWFENWDYIDFVAIGLRSTPANRFFICLLLREESWVRLGCPTGTTEQLV